MYRKKLIVLFTAVLAATATAEWARIQSSPEYSIDDIVDADGILYLAHFGQGVYRSSDSTALWEPINNGLNTLQARSAYQLLLSGNELYVATTDGIYKSTDGGESWISKSDGIQIGPGALYLFTRSIFEDDGTLFTGAWSGIYLSTDGGDSWEATNITGEGIMPGFFINHNGILFAARESINYPNGYLSTDGGLTWEPLTSISLPAITFLSEPPDLWAGTIGGVWLSSDDGTSWTNRSEGLSPDPYNTSIIRVNGTLVTSVKFGGSGIYSSTNDGLLWENFGAGLPFLNSIEKLIVYGDKIIAATSDGLWQRDTSEVAVGIESAENFLPEAYELSQNYPNPFNLSTYIQYSIPEAGPVTLKIYDLLGKQVKILDDGIKTAGKKRAVFRAADLASGIYLYKLQAGDYSKTKRMILLK